MKETLNPQTFAWKSLRITLDFTFTLFLIGILFILYGVIPNRWYRMLIVNSGSMSPTFNAGDLILITRPPDELEPGMILTLVVDGEIVTHRLTGIGVDGSLVTKGDANPTFDDWSENEVSIRGLYRFRIPSLGLLLQHLGKLYQDA